MLKAVLYSEVEQYPERAIYISVFLCAGYAVQDNGVQTAMLLQMMQNAQNNQANCSSGAHAGMDMQSMMPILLAMRNQNTVRGGFSG